MTRFYVGVILIRCNSKHSTCTNSYTQYYTYLHTHVLVYKSNKNKQNYTLALWNDNLSKKRIVQNNTVNTPLWNYVLYNESLFPFKRRIPPNFKIRRIVHCTSTHSTTNVLKSNGSVWHLKTHLAMLRRLVVVRELFFSCRCRQYFPR